MQPIFTHLMAAVQSLLLYIAISVLKMFGETSLRPFRGGCDLIQEVIF